MHGTQLTAVYPVVKLQYDPEPQLRQAFWTPLNDCIAANEAPVVVENPGTYERAARAAAAD